MTSDNDVRYSEDKPIVVIGDIRKLLTKHFEFYKDKMPPNVTHKDILYEYIQAMYGSECPIEINFDMIHLEYRDSKVFRYHNLYSFVVCCGILVPYYEWIYESVQEFRYKDQIYYYDRAAEWYGIKEYKPPTIRYVTITPA